jgi:mono/diheme cytochrome c family protein
MRREVLIGPRGVRDCIAVLAMVAAAGAAMSRTSAFEQHSEAVVNVWIGVYSDEQAQRGKGSYLKHCGGCHGADLRGEGFATPVAGDEFVETWIDRTVGDLFKRIRTTMPAGDPDSLETAAYVDIVAFLLQANKFPPGKDELTADYDVLEKIRILRRPR